MPRTAHSQVNALLRMSPKASQKALGNGTIFVLCARRLLVIGQLWILVPGCGRPFLGRSPVPMPGSFAPAHLPMRTVGETIWTINTELSFPVENLVSLLVGFVY